MLLTLLPADYALPAPRRGRGLAREGDPRRLLDGLRERFATGLGNIAAVRHLALRHVLGDNRLDRRRIAELHRRLIAERAQVGVGPLGGRNGSRSSGIRGARIVGGGAERGDFVLVVVSPGRRARRRGRTRSRRRAGG